MAMAMAGFGSSATGSSTGLRNVENQDDFDRISNLPELLLSQILSLLTTKEAVASSILSKRWRFLWTTITTIDIDFGYKIVSPAFLDSVMNSVLLQRSMPSIHKFSLKVTEFTDESLINQWISAVGRRSVKHIKLSINNYHVQCHTVRGLFDCKNLEVLILFGSGILFDIPKELSICFPALKVLYLMGVRYGEISKKEGSICCFPVLHTLYLWSGNYLQNDDTVNKLLRECPVLEVLHSIGDNLSNIQICSLSLRRFELNLQYPRTAVCKVEIDAPMLQYVTIIGLGEKLILKQIPYSLVEATILVNGRNLWDDILIRSIPLPVDYVKYQAITNAVIGSTSQDPPLFCNLNRLEVTLWCRHMSYLQCFLERSVNLQYLVIQKVPCGFAKSELGKCDSEKSEAAANGTEKLGWIDFFTVPTCLISSLKVLEIDDFYGCPNDVAMIKYMLKNTKVLEKVIIHVHIKEEYGDIKSELLQKISMFPRGSAVCEVEFG